MARKFAFLLTRHFTLSPFALFVDTLRLAGDEDDRSRRVEFDWQVVGERGLPIRASCGIEVMPTRELQHPEEYDDIVVVGGLLNTGDTLGSQKEAFLLKAASRGVRLTALCTASFVLARYGLLDGYNVSVSWLHVKDFRTMFPQVLAHADSLFSVDRSRATCAGGVGAADLAGHFVAESIGKKASEKAAKILILDRVRTTRDVQPVGDLFPNAESRQLRRALLLMESNVQETLAVSDIARSLSVSRRQLERLFFAEIGRSPLSAYLAIRVHYAKTLLEVSDLNMGEIGFRCGFSNAGHFSRAFKRQTGLTPTDFKQSRGTSAVPSRS
ncbi:MULTISPECIES: GlxA family transcriptional regulator [Mesorhizobium]|uniref:GlxA family transcriptional regulator n=2 Tax=Phyllobacteriaceae TaxID=69277 RepID=UPI0007A94F91|nr:MULTISPECIES: GlxA family transcriptional regulator [Mesorhizobium]RUZ90925.1 GlxA family transcriptional regulator [Mesorhizobium sp. M7A.F.Ca.US.003.02.2.1]AMX96564.1 AraC family transcriptional regulator [Mesorhizobium ciceri]MDF3206595.1 GlxA family transcriptional regulator [Mesorhizobium sp. LMG15046]MDF3230161.1 GlxA family transcriptional regulator [Mesorhizobium sp. DSM 30133]RUU21663.1 GlxA family transcriptional regulator [Mesorhizobium sp. Primo-B]